MATTQQTTPQQREHAALAARVAQFQRTYGYAHDDPRVAQAQGPQAAPRHHGV